MFGVDGEVLEAHAVGGDVASKGGEGGLLDDVAELGARVADGAAREVVEVDVVVETDVARVHAEGGETAGVVEGWDLEDEIEPAGTREGGIEALRTVGGGDDEDAARGGGRRI